MTQRDLIPSLSLLCKHYVIKLDGDTVHVLSDLLANLNSIVFLPVGKCFYFSIFPFGFEGSHSVSFLNERIEKFEKNSLIYKIKHSPIYEVIHLSPDEFYISLY